MIFAHPWAWLFLLLAVPVILLYRLRVPVERHAVATGMFWQRALAEERARSQWQRWRPKVSLAVQLLVVVLVVAALAEPQIPGPRHVALIVDNSASMSATDVSPSRLAAAKEVAMRVVGTLRACDDMIVLAAGGAPAVYATATGNRQLLRSAIEDIPATAEPSRLQAALDLTRATWTQAGWTGRIVIVSDGCGGEAAMPAEEDNVQRIRVGTQAANTAITQFTARRTTADPRLCQVFVEVRNLSDRPAECRLSIALDGKLIETLPVSLPPTKALAEPVPHTEALAKPVAHELAPVAHKGRWRQTFEMASAAGGRLTARLEPADDYTADNEAAADVPPVAICRVSLASEAGTALKSAMAANPRVELAPATGGDAGQIHVFDGREPETLPGGPVLVVNPGPCDLWRVGDAVADPTVDRLAADVPFLAGVRMIDVYLPEARRLELTEAAKPLARPLAWSADGTPLGYAIERPQGRVVVLSGNLAASNLAMQTGFPIFVTNALDWLAGHPLQGDEFRRIHHAPRDDAHHAERDEYGCFTTDYPGGVDLRTPGDWGVDAASAAMAWPLPPAWLCPVVLALALLAVEWCLYQRRWIS